MARRRAAVIDEAAYNKITGYIALGRSEGRLLLGGTDNEETNEGGYFVHPAVIADVAGRNGDPRLDERDGQRRGDRRSRSDGRPELLVVGDPHRRLLGGGAQPL